MDPSNLRKQQEHDESTEEEIIEDISRIDEFTESDSDDIPIFLNEENSFGEKKRQLFDIGDEDRLFLEDVDKILSPVNIAKHFKTADLDELKENIVPSNSDKSIKPSKSEKELSPLNDDVILINDKKVSLSSLKKNQGDRQFSSLNYPKQPNAPLRTSHSLDIDPSMSSDDSLNESIEHENSVDEIVEKNSSIINFASANLKEDIVIVRKEEPQPVAAKKMEKITPDYLKEPLDDITEESETESRDDKNVLIETGSQCRSILQNSLFVNRTDMKDEHEQSHSLDIQSKSFKELQDLVIEKDSCLDALNLQLSALIRRENLKEGGRESLRESVPYSFATTTSTEYRTLNEDFNIKIIDIENELHERASFIEQLQTQLAESVQERSKLSEKIMELKSKIAGIESMKSSDEENTMISASRINEFKKSLSEDEAACFSKVWTKFEFFHKNELNQLRQNHELEMKNLQEMIKNDKKEAEIEVTRLRQLLNSVKSDSPVIDELRRELEAKHAKEMEELREYFEKRCVDMEKQYSEEVFSQHSRKAEESIDEESDNETLPDEEMPHESPRKIARIEGASSSSGGKPGYRNIQELESYYLDRIDELQKYHDEVAKGLKLKLQHYESNFDNGKGFSLPTQNPNPSSSHSHAFPNDFNPYNELQKIKTEYDQRLEEQIALAREDVLHEIENNIKTLISENSRDDSNWPPELILLREKLTATNQLEIAQSKIKHEEEMARMKSEYEIQLKRKLKRHAAFDAHRDLDKIISERDSLRDLSESLRFTLCELAKYFTQYDEELNSSIVEELNKSEDLNTSTNITNTTKRFITFKPDISSLITIVEDPELLDFISKSPPITENDESNSGGLTQINIVDCLGRLKTEANNILGLSEQLNKWSNHKLDNSIDKLSDKADSCEEEDGLKRSHCKSLEVYDKNADKVNNDDIAQSLPAFFEDMKSNELHEKLIELKSQLIKSEEERRDLRQELNEMLKRSASLECELKDAKNQLEGKETVTEGFGTQSPLHTGNKKKNSSLVELQEKAKVFLATSPNNSTVDNAVALQNLIEDFCRETDYYIEHDKRDRDDLQNQLEMADKQLKANRKFMEEQAAEREQERDEFSKEIDKLRVVLKEKDKDKTSHENYEKEKLDVGFVVDYISNLESQIKDLTVQVQSFSEQKTKYEEDLKASIDKVFDLREIIADLESQIQTKTLKENVLSEKCKELENYIDLQNQANESFKEEADVEGKEYFEKIRYLEEQLKLVRPSNEQRLLIEQMTSQLKTIEMLLDRKTKTLEAFHALASTCSTTCSSPCEDVSRGVDFDMSEKSPLRSISKIATESGSLPFEEVQRILEKLSKHNRVEEATVKKVTDLEMTINVMKSNFNELQQEKDILQERMSEQLMKISSLQTRLDEQRIRAEELNKQSTSDLTLRVHDLHNELSSLRETLTSRDKQIANLNQLLEHSKKIIERQDHELAFSGDNDKSLYEKFTDELKRKNDEIERLKDRIKSEMISKAVIPDLMETMIAEKNEEIDSLKEQLCTMNRQVMKNTPPSSIGGGTVLSMISECDEPDVIRKMIEPQSQIALTAYQNMNSFKTFAFENQSSDVETDKATIYTSHDGNNTDTQMPSHLIPRRINFTSSADDSSLIMGDVNKLKAELEKMSREKNDEICELKMQLQQQAEEISNLQVDVQAKSKLYAEVKDEKKQVENELDDLRLNIMKLSAYEMTVKKKDEELSNLLTKIEQLEMKLRSQNQDLDNLQTVLVNRDETIQQLNEDISALQGKCKDSERVLVDLERLKKQVNSYNDVMVEKETMLKKLEFDLLKYVKSERELLEKAEQCDRLLESNQKLESDVENLRHELCVKAISLEKCKINIEEMEKQSKSDEHISIEEIASKLDRELNYSAELDTNIAKAIESESEINSELEELSGGGRRPNRYEEKVQRLEREIEELNLQHDKLLADLEDERKHTDEIHMQDAMLMESMNARLKAALDNETVLKRLLESERQKTIQLSSHLTGIQRTKSFDNNLLFGKPLTPESPRRLAKLSELESEVVLRLESEIKLLTSQNDCERDRVSDLQKVLDRERERFNKAIAEQQNYCDQLKREVQRLQNDKQMLENELDQMQEYKHKYYESEKEKYRMDSGNFNANEVPREFMQKLEKINKALDDNVRENHQMNETLQKLINERHALQQRIAELESASSSNNVVHYSTNVRDLEEQNNYLISRFMRSESFRKALIFQKRFILVTLASTIGIPQGPLFKCNPRKKKSFRSIVFMVIAIERFKFIARRWTGKRMMAKVMYTTTPKRSQSASNNNWATFARLETTSNNNLQIFNHTPPTRERTGFNLLPSTSHQQHQSKQSPIQRLQSLFQDTH